MANLYKRKYGVETKIDFELYETDGTDLKSDAAHASGDTKIMKDEGDEANTTNGFVDEGQGYSITLTATEMQAARIVVYVVDQGTKAWLDKVLIVETYGNASAQHEFDLDSATVNLSSTTETQIDAIETDTNEIQGKLPTNKIMGSSDVDNHDTDIDAIVADTNELQGLISSNKLPAQVKGIDNIDFSATMKTSLDTIGDTVIANSDVPNIYDDVGDCWADVQLVLADTNELQTDWANGGRLDLLIDAILADTNELQTDWHDGGRLDLIIDALALEATVAALNDISADDVWDEVMDIAGPANANSAREMLNVVASAVAGKSSGNELGTPTFRNLGDSKNRITSTVDANNNRTAVTQDGT